MEMKDLQAVTSFYPTNIGVLNERPRTVRPSYEQFIEVFHFIEFIF